MINVVSNLVGALAILVAAFYMWKKLYAVNIDFKNYKFYLINLVALFAIILNYFYNFVFIRIFFVTIIFAIVNKLIFNQDNNKTIVSSVLSEFIICISDMLFGLIVIYILRIDLNQIPVLYGTLFANVFVLVMCVGFANFRFTCNIYNNLVNVVNKVTQRKTILFSLLIIISLNILMTLIYFKLNIYYVFVINIVLILIYSYIIVKSLETSSKNVIMKTQNDSLMISLNEYENMLDRQRVDNHENKNQLLIIKNMIKKKDKDVIKYIDTIVKDQKEDDEILYTKVKTIPSGGLQGIIYQKMLVMKDKNIQFSIDVSRDVRKINLDGFSMDNNYKLCKIIGVFLDNAIEESTKINDKKIIISLYEDDGNLIIEVSNKFDGIIELDNIDNEGYTTKGVGHGYGLSLVKKIVTKSDVFINERHINNNIFKQIVRVKVK